MSNRIQHTHQGMNTDSPACSATSFPAVEHTEARSTVSRKARSWGLAIGVIVFTITAVTVDALLGRGASDWWNDEHARTVLFQLHFPRAVAALVSGGALAIAGLLIQTVTGNPLASPELLGISPGAVGGVMVGTVAGLVNPSDPLSALCAALLGALSGGAVGVVATISGGGDRAILAGLVLAAAATGISTIILASQPGLTGMAMRWLAGSTNALTWESVTPMFLWAVPWVIIAVAASGLLPLLSAGQLHSTILGVAPVRTRVILMGVACSLTAGAVALAGPLGFVGLAVPHIMRRLFGAASPWLVIVTLIGGAGGMVACDALAQLIGRVLSMGNNSIGVPVGAVAAIAGAITLIGLLRRRA
ncbi:FecCD family ABC transporter permease [Corynebacterium anserum]|nr:iron ABC transporter permease [Corynebacterium anserum]